MLQGNHKQPHWRGFVTRTGRVAAAGITTSQLAPQQIGFFPDNKKGGDNKSATALSLLNTPAFRIGYGKLKSEASKQLHGGVDDTWISELIYADKIIDYKVNRAKKLNGGSRGEIWTIGYDGLDASKTLEAGLDWHEKVVHIQMRGNPIAKAFGNQVEEVEIYLDKSCVPITCTDEKIAANYLADAFIKKWNKYKLYNKYVKDFVKITKLRLTNPAQAAKTVACNQYNVTVTCDEGGSLGLGRVAAQYPGYKVELVSHGESSMASTYSMWRTVGQGAPANLSLTNVTVPNCSADCPAGYTKVDSAKVFQVIIGNGVTVPALTGEISRSKVSSTPTQDVYLITTATTTTYATVVTNVGATGNPSIAEIGIQNAICNLTTPVTYAWSLCKTGFKASKEWRITLQDAVCEGCVNEYTDRLTELQAKYPDLTIAIEEAGDCIHTYTTTTYSDCTQEECSEDAIFEIPTPAPFDRFMNWEEVTDDLVTVPDCTDPVTGEPICEAVGLKLETAVYNKLTNECSYGHFMWDSGDVDPVMLTVTIRSTDYTRPLCEKETKMLVTKTQEIAYEKGYGSSVRELEYRWLNYYETLLPFQTDPVHRELFGQTAIARSDEFYDEIQLTYGASTGGELISSFQHTPHQVTLRMFFKEGTAKDTVTILNALVSSLPNNKVAPVVY